MAEQFDPYEIWLGVSERARPLSHYQLLGIPEFEENILAISVAADAAIARVERIQAGEYAARWRQLLDELALAKLCLTDRARKLQYDMQLRARRASQSTVAASPAPPDVAESLYAWPPSVQKPVAAVPPVVAPVQVFQSAPVASVPITPVVAAPIQVVPAMPMVQPVILAAPVISADPPTTAEFPSQPDVGEPPEPALTAPANRPEPIAPAPSNRPISAPPRSPSKPVKKPSQPTGPWSPGAKSIGLIAGGLVGMLALFFWFRHRNNLPVEPPVAVAPAPAPPVEETPVEPHEETVAERAQRISQEQQTAPPEESPEESRAPEVPESPPTEQPPAEPAPPQPEATAPKPPEPSTVEPNIEPTPAEQAAFQKGVKNIRAALSARKLDRARQELANAKSTAILPTQKTELARLRLLHEYVEGFWKAVSSSLTGLQAADTLQIGSTEIAIVEADSASLTIHAGGKNVSYTVTNMPIGLALALAERWFHEGIPANNLYLGAFHAVDPKGDRNVARQLWEDATRGGASAATVMPLLDKSPAAATIVAQENVPDKALVSQKRQELRETMGDDFKLAKSPARKLELSRQLLAQAQDADDTVMRYVLFQEALVQAAGAVKTAEINEAVEGLASAYRVDPWSLRAKALSLAQSSATSPLAAKEVGRAAVEWAEQALAEDHKAEAAKLCVVAVAAAKKSKDLNLLRQATELQAQLE